MHRKHPQVLGIGLSRPESSRRPTPSVDRASQRNRVLLERAADPLHRARLTPNRLAMTIRAQGVHRLFLTAPPPSLFAQDWPSKAKGRKRWLKLTNV